MTACTQGLYTHTHTQPAELFQASRGIIWNSALSAPVSAAATACNETCMQNVSACTSQRPAGRMTGMLAFWIWFLVRASRPLAYSCRCNSAVMPEVNRTASNYGSYQQGLNIGSRTHSKTNSFLYCPKGLLWFKCWSIPWLTLHCSSYMNVSIRSTGEWCDFSYSIKCIQIDLWVFIGQSEINFTQLFVFQRQGKELEKSAPLAMNRSCQGSAIIDRKPKLPFYSVFFTVIGSKAHRCFTVTIY